MLIYFRNFPQKIAGNDCCNSIRFGVFLPPLNNTFIKFIVITPFMSEVNFHQAVEEWIEYCRNPHVQLSSSGESVRNCDSYGKIVSMGYKVLPLIRQVYDRDCSANFELSIVQRHGLVSVIREIVGDDFLIPEEIRGRIFAMKDYTKKWLDENMGEYVPTQ